MPYNTGYISYIISIYDPLANKEYLRTKKVSTENKIKYSGNKVTLLEKKKTYKAEKKAVPAKLSRVIDNKNLKQNHNKILTKKKLYRSTHKKVIRPPPKRIVTSVNIDFTSKPVQIQKIEEKPKVAEVLTPPETIQTVETPLLSETQEEGNSNDLKEEQKTNPIELLNERLQNRSVLAEIKPGYSYVKKDNLEVNQKLPPVIAMSSVSNDSGDALKQKEQKPLKKEPLISTVYLKDTQRAVVNSQTSVDTNNSNSVAVLYHKTSNANVKVYKQSGAKTAELRTNKKALRKPVKIDYNKVTTSMVLLRINDRISYDIEAIVFPDNQVSLPIKYLAKLIEVETTQNHVTSSVSFKQPFTEEKITVDHMNKQIMIGTNVLTDIDPKLVYYKDGFIVTDDIYVPTHIVDELLNVRTTFSPSSYKIDLQVNKILKAIVKLDEDPNETSSFVYQEPFQSISASQTEHKLFNIRQLNYNIGSSLSRSITDKSTDNANNSNAGVMATGSLLGGDYKIGTNSLYNKSSLELNGYTATLDYKRTNYDLSLGKTNAVLSQLAVPGASIWGMRLGSVGANKGSIEVPRYIMGRAEENSTAELYINDVFSERQNVKNGEYAFDFVKYPHDYSVKVRVDQISQDKTRKIIYEHRFTLDRKLLVPGQKQLLIFSGIDDNGLNNRYKVFGNNLDTTLYEPVRLVSGSKFRLGIFKKLTMGVNYADTIIIKNPEKQQPNKTDSLYMARTYRMGRTSSGSVMSMDLDYVPLKNLRLNTEGGFSRAKSKIDPTYDPDGNDFGGLISAEYNKNWLNLNLKGFSYGPNYYSGTTTNLIDQRGIDASSRINLGKASISGNIRSYESNLDSYFKGGIAKILEYGTSISGSIDKFSSVSLGVRSFDAENSLYSEGNNVFDITYKRKFSPNLDMTLNSIHNNLNQDNTDLNTSYKSANQLFNMQLDYNVQKLGVFRFSHQSYMMNTEKKLFTDKDNVSRDFTLRLDRSNKFYKGISISPVVGYRYNGISKGLISGFTASHKFKSGIQLVMSYIYNSTCSDTMGGNLLIGGNRSHSLTFNLVQNVNFGIKKLVDANSGDVILVNPDNGIIKGTIFADLNQNGIKEPEEYGIPGIDIKTSYGKIINTDKDGNYILVNLSEGTHKVGIYKENLPAIFTPTVAKAVVNVRQKRVYVANLGIITSPGCVSGKVNIDKKGLGTSHVIVQLLDKDGKEIKYTTTDSEGCYKIDTIPAGEYNIVVNKDYLEYLGLVDKENHKIIVPPVYDDFVDIKNIDIYLSPLQSEAKKFSV